MKWSVIIPVMALVVLTLAFFIYLSHNNLNVSGQVVANSLSTSEKILGVDYHSFGNSTNAWGQEAFLVNYNDSVIRAKVLSQLDQFKEEGITRISTRIWFVYGQNDPYTPGVYHHHFPFTNQELVNIKNYAMDVADRNLTLSFVLLFLYCNDYLSGSPSTLFGATACPASSRSNGTTFILKFGESVNGLLDNVKNIKKFDGTLVVDRIYMSGETILDGNGANSNTRWIFYDSGLWNWFHNTVSAKGIIPTTYFMALPLEDVRAAGDSNFPALNNHMTMERLYLTVKWMKDRNLPLPERIDFDFYLTKEDGSLIEPSTHAALIKKTLDDFEAIIPPLLGKSSVDYFIEEHNYFQEPYVRYLNQKAWKENFYRSNLKGINIWTSPYSAGSGGLIPPLDFNLFLNLGRTGLIRADTNTCTNFDANNLCSTNISVLSVEPTGKIMFLTVINPSTGEEILVGCMVSSFNITIPWIGKNKNYTFILSTMDSLGSTNTCASGTSLLTNSNRLILDKIVILGKEVNNVSTCAFFNYSPWSTCNSSALQSRTITLQSPPGCTGGNFENLIQQCLPPCLESNWQLTDSICSVSNNLTRTWARIGNCNVSISGSINHPNSEIKDCIYVPNVLTCTNFNYSNWSECFANGIENRSLLSSNPLNCTGGNPILAQTCSYQVPIMESNFSEISSQDQDTTTYENSPNMSLIANSSDLENLILQESINVDMDKNTNPGENAKEKGLIKKFFIRFICKISHLFDSDSYSSCLNKYGV